VVRQVHVSLRALTTGNASFCKARPVKKTLFSIAFIAASGVYVAAANHVLPFGDQDTPPPIPQSVAPAAFTTLPQRAPSGSLQAASSEPSSSQLAPTIADAKPVAVAPALKRQLTAPIIAEITSRPVPPLPRGRTAPRPAAGARAAWGDRAAASSRASRDGIYPGTSETAYTGRVQVRVPVATPQSAAVKVVSSPRDRRTSRYINSQALPMLKQEVIAADSANVDTVSGATLTSEAYLRSLGNALQQAGGAGA